MLIYLLSIALANSCICSYLNSTDPNCNAISTKYSECDYYQAVVHCGNESVCGSTQLNHRNCSLDCNCAADCHSSQLLYGYCISSCNVKPCQYDGGLCTNTLTDTFVGCDTSVSTIFNQCEQNALVDAKDVCKYLDDITNCYNQFACLKDKYLKGCAELEAAYPQCTLSLCNNPTESAAFIVNVLASLLFL